jgi:hypothetical protein
MPAAPLAVVTIAVTIITATMNTPMDLSGLLQAGIRYGTIFADPPWFEQGGGRVKRGADRHYRFMETTTTEGLGGDTG